MKTKKALFLILISIFILQFSCEENDNISQSAEPWVVIYKFKPDKDYTGNVYVRLNSEKNRITAYPSYPDVENEVDYTDSYKGYYLGNGYNGIYTAFLDISIEDFQYIDDTITVAGLYAHIIDKNPFEELYSDPDRALFNSCPQCVEMDTTWLAVDTVKFHEFVDNNELEKYLKKEIP